MFKDTHPNSIEANHIVKIFSPIFNFTSFHIGVTQPQSYEQKIITQYTAKSDNKWDLTISFYNDKNTNDKEKQYVATIKFKRHHDNEKSYDEHVIKEKRKMHKDIVDHVIKTYQPDFKQIDHVLKVFVEQGVECGLFKSFDEKKYRKIMKSHMKINHYYGSIGFSANNFGTVTFNKILQKGVVGYSGVHFKKSYASVAIELLAHSDGTIQPYFSIRLPYSSTSKGTCLIPLKNDNKVYFMPNDDHFKKGYVDQMKPIDMERESLIEFFDKEFNKRLKNAIAKALKMNRSELSNTTSDELKEYFILVEMMKI